MAHESGSTFREVSGHSSRISAETLYSGNDIVDGLSSWLRKLKAWKGYQGLCFTLLECLG